MIDNRASIISRLIVIGKVCSTCATVNSYRATEVAEASKLIWCDANRIQLNLQFCASTKENMGSKCSFTACVTQWL